MKMTLKASLLSSTKKMIFIMEIHYCIFVLKKVLIGFPSYTLQMGVK